MLMHVTPMFWAVQVARDLTAKLLEPPEKRKKAEFVHLLNELRTLRLEVGIDELADHLQIVSQVSKGADDYGVSC